MLVAECSTFYGSIYKKRAYLAGAVLGVIVVIQSDFIFCDVLTLKCLARRFH